MHSDAEVKAKVRTIAANVNTIIADYRTLLKMALDLTGPPLDGDVKRRKEWREWRRVVEEHLSTSN
jgi:hypothetical protein